jgi:hypothetical protein
MGLEIGWGGCLGRWDMLGLSDVFSIGQEMDAGTVPYLLY